MRIYRVKHFQISWFSPVVTVIAKLAHPCKQDSDQPEQQVVFIHGQLDYIYSVTALSDSHWWISNQIMDQTNYSVSCLRTGRMHVCVHVCVCLWGVRVLHFLSHSLSPPVCLDLVSTDKSPLDTSPLLPLPFSGLSLLIAKADPLLEH